MLHGGYPCPTGSACPEGSKEPILCPAGTYGFDWLTGGYGSGGSSCNYDYDRVLYWTSTDHSSTEAVSRLFNTAFAGSNRDLRLKRFGFYVRCLKD